MFAIGTSSTSTCVCGGESKFRLLIVLGSGVDTACGGAGGAGGVVHRGVDLTRGRFKGRPRFVVLTSGEDVPGLLLVLLVLTTFRFTTLHSDLSGETIRALLELLFEIRETEDERELERELIADLNLELTFPILGR